MDGGGFTQQRCFGDFRNSKVKNVHGCTFFNSGAGFDELAKTIKDWKIESSY